MLSVFIEHRLSVITRRSEFRLRKRRERLHLVEGMLIAILDIDEVIQVIRASDDTEAARQKLMQVFDLSELQAEYILELRLRRLTKFSRVELEAERDELKAEIERLLEILGSKDRLRGVVAAELDEAAAAYGTPVARYLREQLLVRRVPRRQLRSSRLQILPARCFFQSPGALYALIAIQTQSRDLVHLPERRSTVRCCHA